MMNEDEYVLRPMDQREVVRLQLQHEVWAAETRMVLQHAGFKVGDRLLDLGSGPGCLTLDLADIVGSRGSVLAIDSSRHFVQHLHQEAKARDLPWIQIELNRSLYLSEPWFDESNLSVKPERLKQLNSSFKQALLDFSTILRDL